MKKCLQCSREYDNTMSYCLEDGSELLYGPASMDEPATAILYQEKEMIEAALAECGGRVSGPSGAAVKLGLPVSTLESKIKSLKINKHLFKPSVN